MTRYIGRIVESMHEQEMLANSLKIAKAGLSSREKSRGRVTTSFVERAEGYGISAPRI